MRGKGCFWQQLKADALYLLRIYCFIIGKLAAVGSHGSVGLSMGGRLHTGHLHSSVPGMMTPVLVHLVCVGGETAAIDRDSGEQDPI